MKLPENKILIPIISVLAITLIALSFYFNKQQTFGATPILTVAQGGTGLSSATDNYVIVGKDALHLEAVATSSLNIMPVNGSAYGQMLLWNGSNWVNMATSSLGITSIATINQLGQIGDVTTTTPEVYGHILVWNTTGWESVATSALGITATSGSGGGTISTSSVLSAGLLVQSTAWNTIANIATSSLGLPTNTDLETFTWSNLDAYPAGCSTGNFVSAVGDTLTCTAIPQTAANAGTSGQAAWYSEATTTVSATSTISFATNQTVTIGQGTETMRIYNNKVGIGTTTPYSKLTVWSSGNIIEIVDTASTTLFKVNSNGITTINSLTLNGNTIQNFYTMAFQYATSTWSGTTTKFMSPAAGAITVQGVYCTTDIGTVGVSLYDGTNRANYIATASTTENYFTYSSNNTFTAGEPIQVDLGTPASSPKQIGCRFKYNY